MSTLIDMKGSLIGMVAMAFGLWINSVGTFQKYWRRGVATTLVDAAEAWGKERGAVLSMCDTWLGSPVSLPFWEERMGYERRAVILQKELV